MRNLVLLFCLTFVGCTTPRTWVEFSETNPKTGVVTAFKISLEKELTADELAVLFDKGKGTFTLNAKHLESRSVNVIKADAEHISAIGTAGGNVIKGLGQAAGSAGAIIIGTEGLNAAAVGLSEILKSKLTLDAAKPK